MCRGTFWECVPTWLAGDGAATIIAAVVGAAVVVVGYVVQQRAARRERRAATYSEAIRAVEDYLEAPFLVLRREETPGALRQLTTHISEIQSRIAYYRALLQVYAPDAVASTYVKFLGEARREAGTAMSAAWKSKPMRHGRDVPLGSRFSRAGSDAALQTLIKLMRQS